MNNIIEARRYLDNAKEILRDKARKEDGLYQDRKYVKMAGHTAYTGVLLALDQLFGDAKSKGRKDVSWYKTRLAKMDKKVLDNFNDVYDLLHLSMSYDGARAASVANDGFKFAENIIDWVETRTAPTPSA